MKLFRHLRNAAALFAVTLVSTGGAWAQGPAGSVLLIPPGDLPRILLALLIHLPFLP